jgi:putative transposase
MPVSKKKPTTSASAISTEESSSPILPEQEDFRQYLRRLTG